MIAPNSELTGESVKLLKAGDVLRHSDGRTGFYQSGTVGITVRSVYNGQWVFWPIEDQVTFIGRPDADGWMLHDGGPNPVPGCVVETRSKFDSREGPELSDRINWLNNYDFAQITAFRLAAPSVELEANAEAYDAAVAKPDVAGARERVSLWANYEFTYEDTVAVRSPLVTFTAGDLRLILSAYDRQGEEIERLRGALTLAANRLDRLSLETPPAGRLRAESVEWIAEAREATRAREGGENETL